MQTILLPRNQAKVLKMRKIQTNSGKFFQFLFIPRKKGILYVDPFSILFPFWREKIESTRVDIKNFCPKTPGGEL